jgi:hypothetical protein
VTIQGPGADRPTISGNHASRFFEILGGATVRRPQLVHWT